MRTRRAKEDEDEDEGQTNEDEGQTNEDDVQARVRVRKLFVSTFFRILLELKKMFSRPKKVS